MRRIILILAILLGTIASVDAQNANKLWVGGSASFNSAKEELSDSKTLTNYSILPEFGYVLNNKWGIGLQIGYSHQEVVSMYVFSMQNNIVSLGDVKKMNGYVINPFIRYSFLQGSIGGLFIDGGISYSDYKVSDSLEKYRMLEIGFRPGVVFNVSEEIRLISKLGFLGYQKKNDSEPFYNIQDYNKESFRFNLDMSQIQIGMNLVF